MSNYPNMPYLLLGISGRAFGQHHIDIVHLRSIRGIRKMKNWWAAHPDGINIHRQLNSECWYICPMWLVWVKLNTSHYNLVFNVAAVKPVCVPEDEGVIIEYSEPLTSVTVRGCKLDMRQLCSIHLYEIFQRHTFTHNHIEQEPYKVIWHANVLKIF